MKHTLLILLAAISLASCAKKDEAYPVPAQQATKSPTPSHSTQTQPLRHDKTGTVREPNQGF
jgi:uncharacterized lipoprotein YbaY